VSIDEDVFCGNIEDLWTGRQWAITCFRDSEGYNIFGVGTAGDEVDHYVHDFSDSFKYDEPSDEEKKHLDEIAERLGLPAPSMHQDTYYA
jgi:hypothetical protein